MVKRRKVLRRLGKKDIGQDLPYGTKGILTGNKAWEYDVVKEKVEWVFEGNNFDCWVYHRNERLRENFPCMDGWKVLITFIPGVSPEGVPLEEG
jgi:hypothetical protein